MKYVKYIDKHIKSFKDKTIVITGANSGIGFTLAEQLLYKDAHVVMACRSLERATKAKEKLLEEFPSGKVDIILLDQASFTSIESFSKELVEKYPNIFAFVFNAGIYRPKKGLLTKDDFPLTLGTNYLGPYYLTSLLKEYFKEHAMKVIYVTSVVQVFGKYKSIEKEFSRHDEKSHSYYVSKRCDISLAVHLLDEISDSCEVILTHPGIASTNILNSESSSFSEWLKKAGYKFIHSVMNKAEKSSLTTLRALSDDTDSLDYYFPRGLFHFAGYPTKRKIAPKKYRNDSLYSYSEKLINSKK